MMSILFWRWRRWLGRRAADYHGRCSTGLKVSQSHALDVIWSQLPDLRVDVIKVSGLSSIKNLSSILKSVLCLRLKQREL